MFFSEGADRPDGFGWGGVDSAVGRESWYRAKSDWRCRGSSKFLMSRIIRCLCRWILGWCGIRGRVAAEAGGVAGVSFVVCVSGAVGGGVFGGLRAGAGVGAESVGFGRLKYFLSGLETSSYRELLRRAIVGDHDPENVILMEIDPAHQKTLPDFLLTEKMFGVRTVNIVTFERMGRGFITSGAGNGF